MLPTRAWMDLVAMAIKGYSALQNPHHLKWGLTHSSQMLSLYSTAPANWATLYVLFMKVNRSCFRSTCLSVCLSLSLSLSLSLFLSLSAQSCCKSFFAGLPYRYVEVHKRTSLISPSLLSINTQHDLLVLWGWFVWEMSGCTVANLWGVVLIKNL